jgi:hypothetical protein
MLRNCRDLDALLTSHPLWRASMNQKSYWMKENILYPHLSHVVHKDIIVHNLIWRIKYPLEDPLQDSSDVKKK